MTMRIKQHSEIQHALAHFWIAIDYLLKGEVEAARYELDSIEGLIFFDDEQDRLKQLKGDHHGSKSLQGSTTETQQDQVEAQAKTEGQVNDQGGGA